ncbi:MAG: cytochrome c biogenesis protein ResB [Thermincolia bacterium]
MTGNLVNIFWRFITSVKLAMALIILLTLLILLAVLGEVDKLSVGLVYRNMTIVKTLGLATPLETGFFKLTVYLLLTNTFCCTIVQVKKTRRLWRRIPGQLSPRFTRVSDGENPFRQIKGLLYERGYKVSLENGVLTAQRNRWGYAGPVVLHLGLIVIIVGGLLKLNASMTGIFPVTEGIAFEDRPENYITYKKGSWFDHSNSLFKLNLDKFHYQINVKKYPDKFKANVGLRLPDGESKGGVVSAGYPLTMGPLTIHSYDKFGFAPRLVIDVAGSGVLDSFIALDTSWSGSATEFIFRGEFNQPSSGQQVEVEFYPDKDEIRAKPTKKTYRFDNPAVFVTIKDGQREIYRQIIKRGEEKKQGDLTVAFKDYRAWTSFVVKVDPGMKVVYAGFWLVIGGTAITYLFIPRRIEVWIEEQADNRVLLNMGATTPRFFGSFEEELEEIWSLKLG